MNGSLRSAALFVARIQTEYHVTQCEHCLSSPVQRWLNRLSNGAKK